MRAYSASGEEALRARGLLKDWVGEGLITKEQYERMQQETVCESRRTNIFLRAVMFFFTVLVVAAVVLLFLSGSNGGTAVVLLMAAACYATAEGGVVQGLYRYGVEEALLVCFVVLLCAGTSHFVTRPYDGPATPEFLVPMVGAAAALWVWHRFGLAYAFLGAMICIPWLAGEWTESHSAQHGMIAAIYAIGLVGVVMVRQRYRGTYLNERFSIAEALLWGGLYLAVNLQVWSVDFIWSWLGSARNTDEFSRTFYWGTWGLTWCIPPVILFRGVKEKDRFVILAGGIAMFLTLATNKSYLGWERHTWDPMLLGALLIGVALYLQRWLGKGVRNGFTAQRLSGKDKGWMNIASAGIGLAVPHVTATHTHQPESPLGGGGQSGGGGASSDF